MTHYTFTLTVSLATGSHVCVICSHALTATGVSLTESVTAQSRDSLHSALTRALLTHVLKLLTGTWEYLCSIPTDALRTAPQPRRPSSPTCRLAARWYACQSGHVRAPVGRGGHGVVSGRKVSAQLCPYPCNEVCTSIAGAQASVGRLWEEAVHKLLIILV